MPFDAFSGWVAKWWWLITLVVVVVILLIPGKRSHRQKKEGHSSGTGPEQRRVGPRSSGAKLRPTHRVETPTFPAHRVDSHTIRARWVESPTRTITGKAYVTDGDGIRVARKEVRLAGLDAPEWDQKAKHQDGYWFNHGRRVKRSAACGHTPTTSIRELTDTVSGEGLSNVSSSRTHFPSLASSLDSLDVLACGAGSSGALPVATRPDCFSGLACNRSRLLVTGSMVSPMFSIATTPRIGSASSTGAPTGRRARPPAPAVPRTNRASRYAGRC